MYNVGFWKRDMLAGGKGEVSECVRIDRLRVSPLRNCVYVSKASHTHDLSSVGLMFQQQQTDDTAKENNPILQCTIYKP